MDPCWFWSQNSICGCGNAGVWWLSVQSPEIPICVPKIPICAPLPPEIPVCVPKILVCAPQNPDLFLLLAGIHSLWLEHTPHVHLCCMPRLQQCPTSMSKYIYLYLSVYKYIYRVRVGRARVLSAHLWHLLMITW